MLLLAFHLNKTENRPDFQTEEANENIGEKGSERGRGRLY